ncbi:MAG: hypothetical protein B6242_16425 [Anaerolineaceae bacterium 4572_78]|nr:MAG: hypothetical protein B6242_16425 [Anaerolineaceae bacterium 4572_78]
MNNLNFNHIHLAESDMLNNVIGWVYQSGKIAMRYFNNVVPEWKSDDTFLTQADLEVQKFLAEKIHETYPSHGFIGEENDGERDNNHASDIWVIDPIDGTTVFVQGLPGWGIAVGLLSNGNPKFGVFYMPLLNDISYTTNNGAYYNNQRLENTIKSDWHQKGFLGINSTAYVDYHIDVRHTRTLGSISANLVYVARGSAVATFIPKARLWDLVAGAAILNQVGGEMRYLSGKPINYLDLLSSHAWEVMNGYTR